MTLQQPTVTRDGNRLVMPGLATAHSHAFQRALRGRTQRRATQAHSFWSWRDLMYRLAEALDPDDVFHISRFAFAELAMSGVTAVGEFHYLHHNQDGTPYDDRLCLSEAVVEAALEVGIHISLIRTAYLRAGYQQTMSPAQQRFADPDVETVLKDVDALRAKYADNPMVGVGLAAHSVRAVPRDVIVELASYARQYDLPFHMHVAEQIGEVEACLAEYGRRPVELLHEAGVLDERFVAVHATQLSADEVQQLGAAGVFVCLCRTTERDLGDGLAQTAPLVEAGVKLCVGVDSHASSDAFEEVRAVEMDDRLRTRARHVAATAPELLVAATRQGYEAIGMPEAWSEDVVYLDSQDPALVAADDELLTDTVIFAATPRAVDEVRVAGRAIVQDGYHIHYAKILEDYERTIGKVFGS